MFSFIFSLLYCLRHSQQQKIIAKVLLLTLTGFLLVNFTDFKASYSRLEEFEGKTHLYIVKVDKISKSSGGNYNIKCRTADNERIMCSFSEGIEDYIRLTDAYIAFTGKIDKPSGPVNPGCFNYRNYLLSKGIRYTCFIDSFAITGVSTSISSSLRYKVLTARENFIKKIFAADDSEALLRGVIFGDTGNMDEDMFEDFRKNGTAHVLAVSGLHIGILFSVFRKLMKGRTGTVHSLIFAAVLLIYGTSAMWSVSVIRAVSMAMLSFFADSTCMRYDLSTALAIVITALEIHNPYVILGADFQMTFLAVYLIAFVSPLLAEKMNGAAAVILSVQLGLMPYMAFTFNSISLSGIIAGVPVVFLVSLLVPAGLSGYIIYFISGLSVPLLAVILRGLSKMILTANHLLSAGGIFAFDVTSPPLYLIVFFYLCLFIFTSEYFRIIIHRRESKKAVFILVIILICTLLSLCTFRTDFDKASVIITGDSAGSSVHLRTPEGDMLFNPVYSSRYNFSEKRTKPYLLKNGCRRLKCIFLHERKGADVYALSELAKCFSAEKAVYPGSQEQLIRAGDDITINSIGKKEKNLYIINDGKLKMITACCHITREESKALQSEISGYDCDILISDEQNDNEELIKFLNPEVVILTQSGHGLYAGSNKVIEKPDKKGIIICNTKETGAVGIISGKEGYSLCTENPQNTVSNALPKTSNPEKQAMSL